MPLLRQFALAALCCAGGTGVWAADTYPNRPIRLISPNPAGGANDNIGRVAAARMGEALGQQVVVDNRGGAGGMIGAEIAARAAPDGYTLFAASQASHSVAPHTFRKMPVDVIRDFAPVALFAQVQNVLSANPAFTPSTVQELIAAAKARPGTINYASAGPGSASHFSGLAFAKAAGINIVHIPYKGGAQAMTALIAGEAAFNFGPAAASVPLIKAGRLKAIAVSGTTRARALPDVPTVAESGVPGYSIVGWFGLVAPKGTPPAIIARLNATVRNAVSSGDGAKQLINMGAEPASMKPEAFGEFIMREYRRYAALVKDAGLKVE